MSVSDDDFEHIEIRSTTSDMSEEDTVLVKIAEKEEVKKEVKMEDLKMEEKKVDSVKPLVQRASLVEKNKEALPTPSAISASKDTKKNSVGMLAKDVVKEIHSPASEKAKNPGKLSGASKFFGEIVDTKLTEKLLSGLGSSPKLITPQEITSCGEELRTNNTHPNCELVTLNTAPKSLFQSSTDRPIVSSKPIFITKRCVLKGEELTVDTIADRFAKQLKIDEGKAVVSATVEPLLPTESAPIGQTPTKLEPTNTSKSVAEKPSGPVVTSSSGNSKQSKVSGTAPTSGVFDTVMLTPNDLKMKKELDSYSVTKALNEKKKYEPRYKQWADDYDPYEQSRLEYDISRRKTEYPKRNPEASHYQNLPLQSCCDPLPKNPQEPFNFMEILGEEVERRANTCRKYVNSLYWDQPYQQPNSPIPQYYGQPVEYAPAQPQNSTPLSHYTCPPSYQQSFGYSNCPLTNDPINYSTSNAYYGGNDHPSNFTPYGGNTNYSSSPNQRGIQDQWPERAQQYSMDCPNGGNFRKLHPIDYYFQQFLTHLPAGLSNNYVKFDPSTPMSPLPLILIKSGAKASDIVKQILNYIHACESRGLPAFIDSMKRMPNRVDEIDLLDFIKTNMSTFVELSHETPASETMVAKLI